MKTLRQRIVDVLDKDCEMHDINCASISAKEYDKAMIWCNCKKNEKVDNLLQLMLLWTDDYRQG